MKKLCTALLLGLFAVAAQAQQGAATSQQQRMRDCNAEASQKDLRGDQRQSFMGSCLKGDTSAAREKKMGACGKQAAGKKLKGDARKKFMTECLRG
jgi:psiF repeat-containing protein